jgi:riboflavin kinase/FMN adenylyltransferase
MQRWQGLDSVPRGWGRCVAAAGVFDGVHRGHRALLDRVLDRARAAGLPSVVLIFDPHPAEVLRPGTRPPLLTTLDHRVELLEALGVDVCCVVPFAPDMAGVEPSDFVRAVLEEHLHAAVVVTGVTAGLFADSARGGLAVESVALAGQAGIPFSSTVVRADVDAGNVERAASALGRSHRIEGLVVQGDQRGRTIGFPTANVAPVPFSAVPADGVYAGRLVRWDPPRSTPAQTGLGLLAGDTLTSAEAATEWQAAISIGTNPTFAGQERRVEVHVLDPAGGRPPRLDLYGEHVAVEFVARLREPVRFPSVEALVAQLQADVARTRILLATGAR